MLWVATRKGLFSLRDGRIERVSFLGVPVTAVAPTPQAVYAAVGHGHFGAKLHRSRDEGATWEELPAPKYPEKPKDLEERDPMRNLPIPWNVELIWTLELAGDTLWAGTIPGGLFRNAELVRPLWDHPLRKQWTGGGYDFAGIHSICLRDARRMLVGVSTSGVWRTEDGGASWSPSSKGMRNEYMPAGREYEENVQDPHRLSRCAAAPDVIWAQHHNGIFRSTDDGRSWSELHAQPSSFGFAVAAHQRDPDTAFFVPAIKDERRVPVDGALCVTRTRDGGRTFQQLRRGLPQQHAYDLIYRHGLDLDGERLAMGSTTGSLWTSDDLGESWKTVSSNLPPIYAVRFTQSAKTSAVS